MFFRRPVAYNLIAAQDVKADHRVEIDAREFKDRGLRTSIYVTWSLFFSQVAQSLSRVYDGLPYSHEETFNKFIAFRTFNKSNYRAAAVYPKALRIDGQYTIHIKDASTPSCVQLSELPEACNLLTFCSYFFSAMSLLSRLGSDPYHVHMKVSGVYVLFLLWRRYRALLYNIIGWII